MSHPAPQTKDIARAQAGVITDRLLPKLRQVADTAVAGELTSEGAELILLCFGPLIDELAEHRRQSAMACEIMADALPGNVVQLRGDL